MLKMDPETLSQEIAHTFEETNLKDPEKRAVFERLYNLQGQQAIRQDPRFKELLKKLAELCKEMLSSDTLDIPPIAERIGLRHAEIGVSFAMLIEGALTLEDVVKEKAPQIFPRFLKNIRGLKVAIARIQDKILEESRHQLEEVIEAQQSTIKELQTPIIPVWRGILMAPLMGSFDSMRMHEFEERLLKEIASQKPRFVLLDLSGLAHVDTNIVGELLKLIHAIRLLGTEAMFVGIQPNMARQLTRIDARLEDIRTFATLEQGLRDALREVGLFSPKASKA